jgi:toxin ParE1/3/4
VKSVRFHPDAHKELEAAEAYYDAQLLGLGRAFLAEVERTVLRIAEQPNAGSPYKRTPFRFRLTRRFPYVVYYTVLAGIIWIAAVAHGRRRPGYWMKRKLGG